MCDRIRNDVRQGWWEDLPIATARLVVEIWEAIRPALALAIRVVKQERKSALVDIMTQPRWDETMKGASQ